MTCDFELGEIIWVGAALRCLFVFSISIIFSDSCVFSELIFKTLFFQDDTFTLGTTRYLVITTKFINVASCQCQLLCLQSR